MAKIDPKKSFKKDPKKELGKDSRSEYKPRKEFDRPAGAKKEYGTDSRREFKPRTERSSRPEAKKEFPRKDFDRPARPGAKKEFGTDSRREFKPRTEPKKEFGTDSRREFKPRKEMDRPDADTKKEFGKDSRRSFLPRKDFERSALTSARGDDKSDSRLGFKPRDEFESSETPAPKAGKELKYYGLHACLAIWKKRSNDIIRVYLNEANVNVFKALLKWCADNKKAYHIVPDEELQKVSESVHHEGVCILAKNLPPISAEQFMATLTEPKICLLYLDGVQNPHNIGSILRSCAHFGVPYVLGEQGKLPALSPSACRIAKGGSELVRLVSLEDPLKTLQALKAKGFTFVSTSSHGGTSLFKSKFGPKTVIIMGSETSGVSEKLFALASNKIQIPGTGEVESLNVSVATSLCLGEYARQYQ